MPPRSCRALRRQWSPCPREPDGPSGSRTTSAGNCCATVWHSKGYADGNEYMANKVVESLWRWSDGGQLPVVCDASSCTLGITSEIRGLPDPREPRAARAADPARLDRLGERLPLATPQDHQAQSDPSSFTRSVRRIISACPTS